MNEFTKLKKIIQEAFSDVSMYDEPEEELKDLKLNAINWEIAFNNIKDKEKKLKEDKHEQKIDSF